MDSQSLSAGDIHPTPQAAAPAAAQTPMRVVVEQSNGRFGRFGKRLLWFALGISIFLNFSLYGVYQEYFQPEGRIRERYHSGNEFGRDKVAIVSVEGTILGGDGFVKHQIDRVRDDLSVKAVVLRVDSPGGTVTGSDYIYHHLKKLTAERQIPLVVSMGSIAASGGYYVAMAAGEQEKSIFAEPTTWTGSIGVIIPHYDLSGLLEKWDVQDDSIASHPLKQMGSPTRKLPEAERQEERAILQDLVNSSFEGFKEIVRQSRPAIRTSQELQDEVFTGRIFTAKQAREKGLVDELGFIEEAIDRAVALAQLDPRQVRVVKYHQPSNPFDSLMAAQSRVRGFDLSALLDMTAPRAYYLCTWLPGLTVSPKQ